MKVSIVIPNYNGEALLRKNLPIVFEAVKFYTEKNKCEGEIIVTDDHSSDDSISNIKEQIANMKSTNIDLKLIESNKNVGFSSNVDRGVEQASGEIVVLLNTDVAPEKEFLQPLLSHFTDEKVFAAACMDKSIEGDKTVLRGRGIGKWSRGFLQHNAGNLDKNNTLWASGGSSAFRKSLWDTLGGLNRIYNPFYWEDIDLSYRALKSGYKIVFEKKAVVIHEHEKGAIRKKYSASQVKQIAYRNQFLFVWANATDMGLIVSHIAWLPYHFITAILRGDFLFFSGFFQALLVSPRALSSRNKHKKLFTGTDREVVKEFIS